MPAALKVAILALSLVLLAAALVGCRAKTDTLPPSSKAGAQDARPVLRIGFVPVMNIEQMVKQFQDLSDYLGKGLNMRVELVPTRNYNQLLEKLITKEIDIGTAGSYIGYRAIKEVGAIPLARPQKDGVSVYKGYIVVRKDSGIKNVEQLKGKSFAFVDMYTSAGYVFPRAYLRSMGYDPDQFFGKMVFAGKHDAAFLQVFHRETVGAAAKNIVFDQIAAQNPDFKKNMLVLATSGPFPEKPVVVRPDLDKKLIRRILGTLLAMHTTPEGRNALASFGADRFIRTTLSDFSEVDRLVKHLQR